MTHRASNYQLQHSARLSVKVMLTSCYYQVNWGMLDTLLGMGLSKWPP